VRHGRSAETTYASGTPFGLVESSEVESLEVGGCVDVPPRAVTDSRSRSRGWRPSTAFREHVE